VKKTIALIIFFLPYVLFAQNNKANKGESLKLDWPKSEHWKIGDEQEAGVQHIVDLVHENESTASWTELGNMTSIKGIVGIPVDTAMYMMFLSAVAKAYDPKLTFIQKGQLQDCAWILFSIEAPGFKNDTIPESQLWYVVQGKEGLYTNFIAIKNSRLPEDFKQKWTTFFLSGRLTYN
jgi:hypothetical protein